VRLGRPGRVLWGPPPGGAADYDPELRQATCHGSPYRRRGSGQFAKGYIGDGAEFAHFDAASFVVDRDDLDVSSRSPSVSMNEVGPGLACSPGFTGN